MITGFGVRFLRTIFSLYKQYGMSPGVISRFRDEILSYYRENGRTLPWRETGDPYDVLVSEFMLQQTQVSRVLEKYSVFLALFPDVTSLARAPLQEVLRAWQGLGYNRRAIALQRTAREVVETYHGVLPSDPAELCTLPGIGPYTAGAVAAIAFNRPAVFLDTNIRTVFHYFFFPEDETVTDRDIISLVELTLDRDNPREWYYALFDYGAMLKRERKEPAGILRRGQGAFHGSDRQVRGQVIRLLLESGPLSEEGIFARLGGDEDRVKRILAQLAAEGFITCEGDIVGIREN